MEVKPNFEKAPPGHRNRNWGTDSSHLVKGWGGFWGYGQKNLTSWERTSDTHLCAVLEWEEGDYRFEGRFAHFQCAESLAAVHVFQCRVGQ